MDIIISYAQGHRPTMEDRHIVQDIPELSAKFIGLFDGHGGDAVSSLAAINLPLMLQSKAKSTSDLTNLLVDTGVLFDRRLYSKLPNLKTVGSTSLMALITSSGIHVANCGDSRAIYFDAKGQVMGRTVDHKPDFGTEGHRILSSKGVVMLGRVNGNLAVSRAFGDFDEGLKVREGKYLGTAGPISPLADGYHFPRKSGTYLLLACDGLWDVMSSEQVASFIASRISKIPKKDILNSLVRTAIEDRHSMDNVTVILISFD